MQVPHLYLLLCPLVNAGSAAQHPHGRGPARQHLLGPSPDRCVTPPVLFCCLLIVVATLFLSLILEMRISVHVSLCVCVCRAEKGANCSYVEQASSSSLLLQASLLGQEAVVRALLRCLAAAPAPSSQLSNLLSLGNLELVAPLAAAVAEGNEPVAMVRCGAAPLIHSFTHWSIYSSTQCALCSCSSA